MPLKSVWGCSILHYFAYKLVAYNKKVCFIKKYESISLKLTQSSGINAPDLLAISEQLLGKLLRKLENFLIASEIPKLKPMWQKELKQLL